MLPDGFFRHTRTRCAFFVRNSACSATGLTRKYAPNSARHLSASVAFELHNVASSLLEKQLRYWERTSVAPAYVGQIRLKKKRYWCFFFFSKYPVRTSSRLSINNLVLSYEIVFGVRVALLEKSSGFIMPSCKDFLEANAPKSPASSTGFVSPSYLTVSFVHGPIPSWQSDWCVVRSCAFINTLSESQCS